MCCDGKRQCLDGTDEAGCIQSTRPKIERPDLKLHSNYLLFQINVESINGIVDLAFASLKARDVTELRNVLILQMSRNVAQMGICVGARVVNVFHYGRGVMVLLTAQMAQMNVLAVILIFHTKHVGFSKLTYGFRLLLWSQ